MGEIFKTLGILSNGLVVTVTPAYLIGECIGQSASITREICEKAIGGILFVDEAYQLAAGYNESYGNRESLETLMTFMEEHRNDTCVILSGYENEMHKLFKCNPKLESRISRIINYPDFSAEELMEIFKSMMKNKGLSANEAFFEKAYKYIAEYKKNNPENFGNARSIQFILEKTEQNRAIRLAEQFANGKAISEEDKSVFLEEDLPT